MKSRMILTASWLMSDTRRLRAIGMGALVALALLAGLSPEGVALAGGATGGSH